MNIKIYILSFLLLLVFLGLIMYVFKEDYLNIYLPKNSYSFYDDNKYTRGIKELIPVNIGWNKYGKIKIEDNKNILPCSDINDIIDTVNIYNNINVRGGGHDYNNSSLLGNTIHLTLDFTLNNNNNFIINKKDETIECVSNANFGQLYDFLINNGNYIIPGGTCPNVGISGFTLGGGQSILVSHYGPLCNYLKCISYVNSNGEYIKNDENIEIMRGGGHIKPYIVTSLTYDLKLLKPKYWNYCYALIYVNNFHKIEMVLKYLNTLKNNKILSSIRISSEKNNNHRFLKSINIFLFDDYSNNIDNINNIIQDINNINVDIKHKLIKNKSIYEIYKEPITIDGRTDSIDTLSDGLHLNKSGYSCENMYNSFYISDVYNGTKITQDIIDSFPDLLIFDHHLYNKHINDNTYKSIFPVEKNFNGWILQSISNNNTNDLIYNTNNVPKCFTKKNNYKYINYPPTSDNNLKNISLDTFFEKDTVKKIKRYKNKHDNNSKFVTIHN